MSAKHLNVLMVLADQHHADLLGCAGHSQVITPRFDAFAAEGQRFTNAYCQNPICTPSRTSILSGQYCHNHGYYGLSGPADPDLPNLFRHFRQAGYRTAGFGKLHLPTSPRNWIADDVDRFGDTYERADGTFGESDYFDELERLGMRHLEDSWHSFSGEYGPNSIPRDAMPSKLPFEHTQEAWSSREAQSFIKQNTDQPFFIQIAFQKPHHPLLPVRKFWDLYPEDLALPPTFNQSPAHRPPHFQKAWQALRDYHWEFAKPGDTYEDAARRAWRGTLACISQIDFLFGQLLDFLDQTGLADNTLVIYGSDHGAYHGIHGIAEKAPGICSDAVCRVPMIWRVPGVSRQGAVSDALVQNIDMAPTLCDLCGLTPMRTVDGANLTPLLAGEADTVHHAVFTENAWSKAVRWDRWRLVHYPDALFTPPFPGELYDLRNDPGETRNLFTDPDHAAVVNRGHRLIMDWLAQSQRVRTYQPTSFEGERYRGSRHYPLCSDRTLPNDHKITPQGAAVNYL